eukprot:scaffold56457_cov70-Phaeocystis_antarctica.AAC.6
MSAGWGTRGNSQHPFGYCTLRLGSSGIWWHPAKAGKCPVRKLLAGGASAVLLIRQLDAADRADGTDGPSRAHWTAVEQEAERVLPELVHSDHRVVPSHSRIDHRRAALWPVSVCDRGHLYCKAHGIAVRGHRVRDGDIFVVARRELHHRCRANGEHLLLGSKRGQRASANVVVRHDAPRGTDGEGGHG